MPRKKNGNRISISKIGNTASTAGVIAFIHGSA